MQFKMDQYDESSPQWLKLNYIINDERDDDQKHKLQLLKLSHIDFNRLEIPQDPRLNEWSLYQFAIHLYDKLKIHILFIHFLRHCIWLLFHIQIY